MTTPAYDTQTLGEGDAVLRTTSLAETIAVTDHMAAQAMRTLDILAPDTEPELYGRDAFGRVVSDFIARRSKTARVRLLLADPARARHQPHHLIELWHRFPSFVDVRELRDIYAETREALLIVDGIGLIRRPEKSEWDAVVTYKSLTTARDRSAWFAEAWTRAAPCSALRRLGL